MLSFSLNYTATLFFTSFKFYKFCMWFSAQIGYCDYIWIYISVVMLFYLDSRSLWSDDHHCDIEASLGVATHSLFIDNDYYTRCSLVDEQILKRRGCSIAFMFILIHFGYCSKENSDISIIYILYRLLSHPIQTLGN